MLVIAEIFGHGQAGQTDAETDGRRLVHLAEDHDGFIDNAGCFHFIPEVVAFTGPFTDAGENGETAVFGGDVADKFLDNDGFTDSGAAVGADLAAFGERRDQVNDFQPGFQQLGGGFLLDKGRRAR